MDLTVVGTVVKIGDGDPLIITDEITIDDEALYKPTPVIER